MLWVEKTWAQVCISIAILDFDLTEDEEYFHCYKFRDENGKAFSEAMTVYILELDGLYNIFREEYEYRLKVKRDR